MHVESQDSLLPAISNGLPFIAVVASVPFIESS